MAERTITNAERKWAREVISAVESWQSEAAMLEPNVERLPGIDALVRDLIPLFGMATSDPVMARCYVSVPRDMKCHKCGASEPWKDPSRDEVTRLLEGMQES